ncbi:M20/M25/M40 family metallo-hydrolase [Salinivirga cyanobacteriivorans]
MKIFNLSTILLLIFFIPGLHSLNAQKQQDKALKSIIRDVYVLANDSLQGRQSGLPSVEKSIKYIEKRYKEIGLTTHPKMKNYRQPFKFYTTHFADSAWIKTEGTELDHRRQFYTTRYAHDTTVKAKAEYIEYEQLCRAIIGKKQLTIEGKIALINIKPKPKKNAPYPDSAYSYKSHILHLTKIGAAGIILMGQKDWYSNLIGKFEDIKTTIPVFYTFPDYENMVMSLASKKIEMGAKIPKKEMGENIIGYIDNNADNTIIIGAHYDHLGLGYFGRSEEYKDSVYNGADDNASGVAGMLTLAEMLKKDKNSRHNYLFLALAAEERGKKGSQAFVASELFNADKTLIYINYDMIGRMRKMRDKLFLIGRGSAEELPQLLKKHKYTEGKLHISDKTHGGSDHAPFYDKKIPFLYFTTGLHTDYHTWKDNIKHLNFEGIKYTVDYTFELIKALDQYETLKFTPAKYMSLINWIPMYLP